MTGLIEQIAAFPHSELSFQARNTCFHIQMMQPPLPLQYVAGTFFPVGLTMPRRDHWTFSFDEGAARGSKQSDYEGSLKSLGSFDTVQGFWRHWNALSDKCVHSLLSYHLMNRSPRNGVAVQLANVSRAPLGRYPRVPTSGCSKRT